jgi:hypothetical protein
MVTKRLPSESSKWRVAMVKAVWVDETASRSAVRMIVVFMIGDL